MNVACYIKCVHIVKPHRKPACILSIFIQIKSCIQILICIQFKSNTCIHVFKNLIPIR